MTSEERQTVFDVPPGQFQRLVIEESFQRPVVVDFWAEWCVPCRALGPILERVVLSFEGRAALARVNVEQDRETAVHYAVQSIPAVKVFRDGQVVTEFVGALPEAQVAHILRSVVPSHADELVAEGDGLMERGDVAGAEEKYSKAVEADPQHSAAMLRLGSMAVGQGRAEEARSMLSRIEQNAPEYDAARGFLARLEFGEVCREKGGKAACEERLAQNPDDLDSRYDLACCLAADGEYEAALGEFLKVVAADKNYRDQAAKKAMVHIFSLVGPRSELADAYRKKLAGVLY